MADLTTLKQCQACACFCWLVAEDCIIALSELTSSSLIRTNDINNANSDVGDLITEKCFRQLCESLSFATSEMNVYNEDISNVVKKSILDFLEPKWYAIITNMHFKTWYSNRVAWHWLEGSSITQLKAVGLITTSNTDEEFKNGFKHAGEAERKRLSASAERYASNAGKKFKDTFWNICNIKIYDCIEDCCDNIENLGSPIGMSPAK